jgi:hypothetical protein
MFSLIRLSLQSDLHIPKQVVSRLWDPDAPVSFQLAPGWTLAGGMRWGDHETTLRLQGAELLTMVSLYYQYPLQQPITRF